jgi:cation transport regulator ChaC
VHCLQGHLLIYCDVFNLQYLELREFEYDERAFIDFYTEDSPCTRAISVLVYIGSPNRSKNQYYLGPAPLEDIASQIAKAAGPAGPNYEYLFRLEEALYEIGMLLSVDASYFNAIYDDP